MSAGKGYKAGERRPEELPPPPFVALPPPDVEQAKKDAQIVLDAPTDVGGGSINVWLARDVARHVLSLVGQVEHGPRND